MPASDVVDVVADHAVFPCSAFPCSISRAYSCSYAAIIRAGKKSVPYAGVIHWGWPRKNIVAQPWLTEAAASTESTWVDAYTEAVDEILETIEGTRA